MVREIEECRTDDDNLRSGICVFAGTVEGRQLCEHLSAQGVPATAFVATDYGGDLLTGLSGIRVKRGRLDESAIESAIVGEKLVVDATHPYAIQASANIKQASAATGVHYLRLARPATELPSWAVQLGSAEEAAAFLDEQNSTMEDLRPAPPGIPHKASSARREGPSGAFAKAGLSERLGHTGGCGPEGGDRALITTGLKELAAFTAVEGFAERFFVRVLPLPQNVQAAIDLGFPSSHVIGMQGPFTQELNVAMLHAIGARWLVTKDGGRVGGMQEKIAAAEQAGAGLIVITRPDDDEGLSLEEVLERLLGQR